MLSFLLLQDKWFCLICEHSNGPLHRFCESCWTLRPNWLPRPPPKVPVLDKTEKEFAENQMPTTSAAGERGATANCSRHGATESGDNRQSRSANANSQATCSQSSIRDDSSTSQEILNSQDSGIASLASASSVESTSKKSADLDKTQGSIGPVDNCVQDLQNSSNSNATLISPLTSCIICFSRPKEATIVHGKTGHQCCCYQCACRLKRHKRPCPVCRRDIQKVIRNYPV